ncbi:MAG: hypothetical protein CMJ46_05985 [Planctomyces sp.]|nr:hypothetical protein [Planctomyces sp.]
MFQQESIHAIGMIPNKGTVMIQKSETAVENMRAEKTQPLPQHYLGEEQPGAMCQARSQAKAYVEQNPGRAILIGLGAGIGAGLLIGAALQRSSESYAPQGRLSALRDRAFNDKLTASIKTTLSETIPSFMKKHMPDAFRS